jgi:hypothetical protein
MGFSTFVSASTLSAYRPEVAVEAILAMRAPATVTALLLETHATTVYVRQQEAEVQMLVSTPTTASSPSILSALSVCVSASMQSVLHPPTLMNVPPTQVAALELHVKMVFVLTTPIALVQLIVSLTLIFAFCREFVLVSMVFVDWLVMDPRRSVLLLRIVELCRGVVWDCVFVLLDSVFLVNGFGAWS